MTTKLKIKIEDDIEKRKEIDQLYEVKNQILQLKF